LKYVYAILKLKNFKEVLYYKGKVYYKLRNLKKAKEKFNKCIKLKVNPWSELCKEINKLLWILK